MENSKKVEILSDMETRYLSLKDGWLGLGKDAERIIADSNYELFILSSVSGFFLSFYVLSNSSNFVSYILAALLFVSGMCHSLICLSKLELITIMRRSLDDYAEGVKEVEVELAQIRSEKKAFSELVLSGSRD